MAKGSRVYRRDEQRTFWGYFTVRQRNILLIGLIVSIFLINAPKKEISHPEFQWSVRAVPIVQKDFHNSIDPGYGTDMDADYAEYLLDRYPVYEVNDIEISYTETTAQISWPEDANYPYNYKYDVFLNGEKVGESGFGYFVYQYAPDSPKNEGTYKLPPIYVLKAVVFLLFFFIAYVDYNGTYLERYALRMFQQYIEFRSLIKLPVLGISIKFPVLKQTKFSIGTQSIVPVKAKSVVRNMSKPKVLSLQEEPVIEKVFTDISQPIRFSSNLGAVEITHPKMSIVLTRDKKGEISIVLREK